MAAETIAPPPRFAPMSFAQLEVRRERIPKSRAAFLTAVALLFDGIVLALGALYIIPFVGFILVPIASILVAIFAWLTFYIWFTIIGDVSFEEKIKKRIISFLVSISEIFPILNILPFWTFGTVLLILIVRHEDSKYNKLIRQQS